MWHLSYYDKSENKHDLLFSILDDVCTFVLNQAEFYQYEMRFLPKWEAAKPKTKSPSDSAEQSERFPIPLSRAGE